MQDAPPSTANAEAVFQEAISVLPTARMYSLYSHFLQQQLQEASDFDSEAAPLSGTAQQWATKLLAVHEQAIAAGVLTA